MSVPGYLTDAELNRLEDLYPELKTGKCPTCDDKLKYKWQGQEHDCLCSEQKRLRVRYFNAGIGDTFQRLSWGDVHFDLIDSPLIDYLDNAPAYIKAGMGLLLHGDIGSGKTMLGNLVLKELVKLGYNCFATTFASTVTAMTAGWGAGNKAELKWFEKKFLYSDVLLLDDLGKEFRSTAGLSPTTFDHILRTRVTAGRPTILTTNMTAQELRGGYGAAVLSLLLEQSIDIELKGEDFRPKSNLRKQDEVKAKEQRPIT
jgi:DNA replication protein DnaC